MDFAPPAAHHNHPALFNNDLDQQFNPLDHPSSPHAHPAHRAPAHPFEHTDLDVPDQPAHPFDLFSNAPHAANGFASPRYRTNASSSSSLGPSYAMAGDQMYSHPSFADSVNSFHGVNSNSYDMIHSLSSSYSSGKVSPLTPSDPSIQHSPVFPGNLGPNVISKDFPGQHPFPDVDRRLPNSNFPSDFHEDYAVGVNGGLGLGFNGPAQHLGRFPMDSRFPSQMQHHGHHEMLQGVSPQATHFRPNGIPGFDDGQFMNPNPQNDLRLSMGSDDHLLAGIRGLGGFNSANDLQTFIRPYLDQYVRTPNRLAFGERTVIVMSSKVAQKSYGTEKRFLCPPPTAIMIGNSWWSDVMRRGQEPKLCPPRVVVSISGEPAPPEGNIEWTSAAGKSFEMSDPPAGTTYIGRCVGKQLFISDVDEKKKKVEALVKIMAPASDDDAGERVIGTFASRSIKVISKPSKKRQSAKNLELCINHGSTVSLFHRLRSQTVSTKYLCVSGSGSAFKGSDGAPLMGLDHRSRSSTPSFIARTASWDPFVMYIVDVNKPAGGIDAPPPPPPHPEYPSPPPNAIPFTNNGSQIPIYYNQTVVLQCLTSGVVSPILIIRKVDHGTTVVGGGLQEGAKGVADHYCVPGEVCGDPVSQLHKIAFEVYEPGKGMPEPGTPGMTGAFLSCMGEKVNTYRPTDGRLWVGNHNRGSTSPSLQSPVIPGSPVVSTPASLASSSNDYFAHAGTGESAPASPMSLDFPSNDGGRVKKMKRGSSSTGGITKNSAVKGGRRRPTSAGSGSSPARRTSAGELSPSSGALWQVDIGETSVWTIVGTDQVRYNFYIPPVLFDNQNAPQTGSFPIPSKPVTPFPAVVKYLPPDRASEMPKSNCAASRAAMAKPNPAAAKMLTVYGENFSKSDPLSVFFGSEPSPYVEIRCTEVLGCLPPESPVSKRRPIILVRHDGVVFPSHVLYP
ncbi:LAG1-DNAbind-domain-containing protein [Gloeophyllum trabeum ATCC 11539]|uniref:LAG1-DNAbind-domain-containing protein n=1 Tax=Gloeophyllum trabeum (strain ATCC 11539 / FP-39264 / Madison 617) TaxID=670483 RepID=S7QD93_GLOTA|nr:LAG1-DNAbind-domain-containing protein [Gloeophyllum trabeum ATCC 11539]EPQ57307.1 LAG1-DNAbind-domain-containing protein [Gloeophyllum trabeum ATCC 11539]